jgi:hypothetical protein
MTTNAIIYWQFIDPAVTCLCDPRINITGHIDWTNPGVKPTAWSGPEPDNYNFAIFDQRPHDLEFVKDQVWYKIDQHFRRARIKGWMSVYYIAEQESIYEFRRSIIKLQPQAFWSNPRCHPLRAKRTMLERENVYKPRSNTNFSTEERLWQLGYYEKFKVKYQDDETKLFKVVGTPRGAVLNYQQEVDDQTDYCDN